jgi:hypothetical protein
VEKEQGPRRRLPPFPGGADPDWVIPLVAALVFFGAGLAVSLLTSPLGDQASEADFFAELAPAAQQLMAGEFSVANYPFKGPVYSFVLAGTHALLAPAGVGWYRAGVGLSLLASALTLLLLYRLVRHLAGRQAGVVVLVLTAVTKVYFIHAGKAASDHLFLLFMIAAAHQLLARPARSRTWLVVGVLGGLAFLTRYIGAVVPAWSLAVVLLLNPDRLRRRQRLVASATILAGFMLVLTPWLARTRLETGSLLVTRNLQNVVQEFYGGERSPAIPVGGFASLVDLISHDPGYFCGHFAGNVVRHAVQDFQQVTGPVFGVLAGLGLLLMAWRRPDRRQFAWLALGALYFLALCAVFYVPRFSFPLAPFFAFAVAWLLAQVPRYRKTAAVVVVGLLVVVHVGYVRRAVAFYHSQQPTHLAGAIAFLGGVEQGSTDHPPVLMARRAHAAHYAGLVFQPYPGRIGGAADLLRAAAARRVDYLLVGAIERNSLTAPTLLDHLEIYEGVDLVYQDDVTRIFALHAQDNPAFATRRDVKVLAARRDRATAAGDSTLSLQLGLELGRIMSEDGDLVAARDLMQELHDSAGGRNNPTVGLNLAWLCLEAGDIEHGLAVVTELLRTVPALHGTASEARALGLQGRLLARSGDLAAARTSLSRARDRYLALGATSAAAAAADELSRLGSR